MNKQDLLLKLKKQNLSDKIILAFDKVDRSFFVPPQYFAYSYADRALPIGNEQTISQPSTIAFMLSLLELKDNLNVLEVGSGSGYVLALLAEIVKNGQIYGTERIGELVLRSKKKLLSYPNITIVHSPMTLGLPDKAPFDRILVSASSSSLPDKLIDQLSNNGIMVIPVQNSIIKVVKINDKIKTYEYPGFVFVKLYE